MTGAAAVRVTPAPPWRVLVAGLVSARRRPGPAPVLPDVRLTLPVQRIESARVADYAAVCGFARNGSVPPIFPHILAFPLHLRLMMQPGFPFPMAGTVHIANHIVQHVALAAGDALAITATAGALLSHPKGQAFAIDVAITRDHAPVWQSRSIYLHRQPHAGQGAPVPPPLPARQDGRPRWTDTVPRDIGRRYARVSGDHNPIHTSAIGARLFGFPRPIAHGMWSLARTVAALLPERYDRVEIDAAFAAPLLLPGTVALHAADCGTFALCAADGGRAHLTGTIRC